MNEALAAAVVGALAGTHSATWGMYKDSPHEGFTWPRYFRSIVLAAAIAPVIALIAPLDATRAGGLVVLFAATYGVERALVELYKTFLREQDQSKYTIPMQFSVRGKVVKGRARRLLVGAAYFSCELLVLWAIIRLQRADLSMSILGLAAIGSVGGWISAVGGAWKDAPIEGFETLKFFRSPAIAFLWSLLLALLTGEYALVFLGGIGLTVATTETYKTFFFPSRPRGKFAGKPVRHPELLRWRNRFVPLYAAIWAALLVTMGIAFAGRGPALP